MLRERSFAHRGGIACQRTGGKAGGGQRACPHLWRKIPGVCYRYGGMSLGRQTLCSGRTALSGAAGQFYGRTDQHPYRHLFAAASHSAAGYRPLPFHPAPGWGVLCFTCCRSG